MSLPFPFNLINPASIRMRTAAGNLLRPVPPPPQKPDPQRVTRTAQVVLDSNGNGSATLTAPAGVMYDLVSTSVSTTAAVTDVPPQCTTYLAASATPSAYFESTYQGNRKTSDTTHRFNGSEPYTAAWTAGTPGSIATLTAVFMQTEV